MTRRTHNKGHVRKLRYPRYYRRWYSDEPTTLRDFLEGMACLLVYACLVLGILYLIKKYGE